MANIESKLTVIKSASGGEDVRDAIIGALRDINNDVPADMSNPVQKEYNMPPGSDLTVPLNPPELVSQIIVRQAGSGGKSTTLNEITITENGEYPTDEEGYDSDEENRYYKKVTVNVPQLANAVMDLEEEITQNGTYSAPADWGVDGIRTFTVNVNAATGDGPFQVEFYGPDRTTVIETQLVPAYGSASCTKLDGTTYLGQNFKGWNPSPSNITRDMKCYPVYGDYIINPGEIQETWEQICSDGGAHVPIGGYRNLIINVYANADWNDRLAMVKWRDSQNWYQEYDTEIIANANNQLIFSYPFYMVKVAEGEDGTHSTWISTGCGTLNGDFRWRNSGIDSTGATMSSDELLAYYKAPFGNWSYARNYDWEMCPLRQILNGKVFAALEPALQQNIKQVTKYTRGLSEMTPNGVRIQKSTLDKIWVPSAKEVHTLFSIGGQVFGSNIFPNSISEIEEVNGIDYSAQYVPSWPDGTVEDKPWIMRTEVSHLSGSQEASPLLASERASDHELIMLWSDANKQSNYIPFGFCL